MAITVIWNDGVSPETQFTMPDDVITSLDQFRQTITDIDPTTGIMRPKYASVKDMTIGIFVEQMILPALRQYPTAGIQTAQANLAAAQASLAAAQAAAIPGFVPTGGQA